MKNDKFIEYQITKQKFNFLLEQRTEDEKKINPYVYVMGIINAEYGLRGTVKKLAII